MASKRGGGTKVEIEALIEVDTDTLFLNSM